MLKITLSAKQRKKNMTARIKFVLLAAVFIGGFSSLSLELIVLRQLSGFVGSTAITTSVVIGIFLAFMSLGYYAGSEMKIALNSIRRTVARDFLLVAVMVILASSYILLDIYFGLLGAAGIRSNVIKTFIYSLAFLSVAPYLFGKITALLSRYLHRYNHNYTGKLMAVDTVGSVLGSILTTLAVMPFIGVNYTIVVVVVLTGAASVLLSRCAGYFWFAWAVLAAVLLNRASLLHELYDIVENNAVSTISILDTDNGQARAMVINGGNSSKISVDRKYWFGYVRYIQENFIETLPKDRKKDVLILGAGGFTMGEGDAFHNYTFLDIDRSLLKISEEKFLKHKLTPNKRFVVEDANQFLKDNAQKYDLIVLDTYSGMGIIPMDLITKEYFTRVKNNLKKGGIVVMNILTSPNFSDAFAVNLDNTIRSVFTHSLSRQVIGNFNAWGQQRANVIYVYYDIADEGGIYTADKNAVFYDM